MTEEIKKEPDAESFTQFGLSEPLLRAINDLGYEAPTPIQVRTIPLLLDGRNVIGQAQTGTGKTAAFALPILEKIDLSRNVVQALVLTPTRELSIQVAEAFPHLQQTPGPCAHAARLWWRSDPETTGPLAEWCPCRCRHPWPHHGSPTPRLVAFQRARKWWC